MQANWLILVIDILLVILNRLLNNISIYEVLDSFKIYALVYYLVKVMQTNICCDKTFAYDKMVFVEKMFLLTNVALIKLIHG